VKGLLRTGSDSAIENKSGSTPVRLAVQNTGGGGTGAPAALNAQREIIKAFLAFGVDPYLKNSRAKA
jgi:hypothetical protein